MRQALLWEQFKLRTMEGTNEREVTTVCRKNTTDSQAFCNSDHTCINQPYIGMCIPFQEDQGALKVIHGQNFDFHVTLKQRNNELSFGFLTNVCVEKITCLRKDKVRHDQCAYLGLEKSYRRIMPGVVSIRHSIDEPSINNNLRHQRETFFLDEGSLHRSSSHISEMSLRPLRPIPKNKGVFFLSPCSAMNLSSACLTISATLIPFL